jgi:hypothetical protein
MQFSGGYVSLGVDPAIFLAVDDLVRFWWWW